MKHYVDDKIKMDEMGEADDTCGKVQKCLKVLVGHAERKCSVGRRKHSHETVKMDLREKYVTMLG
jgi:hypothetical protein